MEALVAYVLLTGCAGFIGFHAAQRLVSDGHTVLGVDDINPYYDPRLKQARLALLPGAPAFEFVRGDIADAATVEALFQRAPPRIVVHLAAQGGVRYSIENPRVYIKSNLVGFFNVLDAATRHRVDHLVYASSSSVYGANVEVPFSEEDTVDRPLSLYAATKKSNELMAYAYAHVHGLPATALRFFTVYGPWGRPDMAPILFARAILEGRPIQLFNGGDMQRDFTYIDDVVEVIARVVSRPPGPNGSGPPHRVLNVGNSTPVQLLDFVETLERHLGRSVRKELLPMQPGDVPATWADTSQVEDLLGYAPATPLDEGLRRFAAWALSYYRGAAESVGA
jgi:UDP-glucuronate 4-epimerase